jgi:glycosyltransferase involved in cell wall biosynthesis
VTVQSIVSNIVSHFRGPVRLVSFIIPAWNEELLLARTLDALGAAARALSLPSEVIVVDDGSSDRTADIAREHGSQVLSIHRRQIAAARNAGAGAARGDLFIFVDADTRATPEVVRAAVEAVGRGAVGGGCAVRFEGPVPIYARALVPVLSWLYGLTGMAAGCFLFCTRAAFDAVGGFDETLFVSEECRLSLTLKSQGRFVVLRQHVVTSARKLRMYSAREVLASLFHLGLGGRAALRRRGSKGMELWYGPRRADPAQQTKQQPE